MSETFKELELLSDNEIKQRHDQICKSFVPTPSIYLEIISRRSNEEYSKRIERISKSMNRMTFIILLLTIINVLIVISTNLPSS
jgi:hypothetical protein